MRLPVWLHTGVWLCFGLVVLLPPVWLLVSGLGGWLVDGGVPLLEPAQMGLLLRSLGVALFAALLATLLGAPYALLCERTQLPAAGLWRFALLLPLGIPPFIHALSWSGPVGALRRGALGPACGEWGTVCAAVADLTAVAAVGAVLALAYFPFVALLTIAGLRGVERGLEETALLSAPPTRVWRRITLPLVLPQVLAGALFVLLFALMDFAVPDVLRLQVYPVEIFVQFSALYDQRAATVLSVPLLCVCLLAVAAIGWLMRGRAFISLDAGGAGHPRIALGRWRGLALAGCAGVLALSVGVPLLHLLPTAGPPATYLRVLRATGDDVLISAAFAAGAALLTVGLGLALSLSLSGLRRRIAAALDVVTVLPFAMPPILLGIALIQLWNRPATDWLYGTSAMLLLGYLAHFAPFTVRIMRTALTQIAPAELEAAWLHVGALRAFWRVLLPQMRNALLAGLFICFVLCLGELGVTLLVTPPGLSPIPIDVYNYLHYGAHDRVAALCVLLLLLQAGVGLSLFGLRRQ